MKNRGSKRIAIVDDDHDLVLLLRDEFEAEGYVTSVFYDALPLLRHVREHGLPHLALIDLHLPSMHGFELSKTLKSIADVPIVFISNENESETVIDGIIRYADDFVTKPFNVRELLARVKRILSRISDFEYLQFPVTQVDDRLAIDFSKGCLLIDDRCVMLTPIEANLLYILIRNAGYAVPFGTLIDRVWPVNEVPEETLRVHMHRLRRKLERDSRHPVYIQTARGIGYRFVFDADS